ncbi:MAG: carbohydrate porin [Candidatus Marinimicrobia bacterium]|nr:carbohydrate porin [Candidatus Neomarinimicrobiota bacterium]
MNRFESVSSTLFVLLLAVLIPFGVAEGTSISSNKLLSSESFIFDVNAIQDIFEKYNDRNISDLQSLGLFALGFTVDLNKLISWDGLCFHMNGITAYSRHLYNQEIELAELSNIQSGNTIKLQELWLKQNILEKGSLLLGVYDLNSEFDVNLLTGTFLNGSFGMGPDFSQSGKNGVPTFPDPALAFRIKINLCDNIYLQTAISDGVPGKTEYPSVHDIGISEDEGALLCTEIGYRTGVERMRSVHIRPGRFRQHGIIHDSKSRRHHHWRQKSQYLKKKSMPDNLICRQYEKAALGIWYYSADFEPYNNNVVGDVKSWGGYILGEKVLWGRSSQLLGGFARFGWANPRVNPIAVSWSCGIVLYSFSDQGNLHDLGLAIETSCFSKDYRQKMIETDQQIDRQQNVIEFYWGFQINDTFMLQPDLQYIVNLHEGWSTENNLALGLRCAVSL